MNSLHKKALCLLLAGMMALSALSGCSSEKTDEQRAEDALNSFAAAVENGDEDAAQDALEGLDDLLNGGESAAPAGDEGAFPRDPR